MCHKLYYFPSSSECPAGTYSDSVSNSPCQSCPDNSEASQTGLSECPCVQNHYRALTEEAGEACTRELWMCMLSFKELNTELTNHSCYIGNTHIHIYKLVKGCVFHVHYIITVVHTAIPYM